MLAGAGLGDISVLPIRLASRAWPSTVGLCAPPCSRSSRFRYRVVRVPSVDSGIWSGPSDDRRSQQVGDSA